jgi:hypothetical protein
MPAEPATVPVNHVFRPLWATVAALAVGALAVAGILFVGLGAAAPGSTDSRISDPRAGDTVDRALFVLLVVLIVVLMWRLGGVYAKAAPSGLVVRNIIRTTRLEWPQILAVQLSAHDSWVMLDVADGTTLAVMAIQRADGNRGIRDVQRLAALVRANGEASTAGAG